MKTHLLFAVLLMACFVSLIGCSHTPPIAECHGKATPVNPQAPIEVPHGARHGR